MIINNFFKQSNNKMFSLHSRNITLPSNIYYTNPYSAVRSILGNDVEIINIEESDIILPNDSILLKVDYKMIDFNSFKLYKVVETKALSQQSNKKISTVLVDTITNEQLTDRNIMVMTTNTSNFYVFLKYSTISNSTQPSNNITSYYGLEVSTPNAVLHSYCSIFDSNYLSYHGNDIPAILKDNERFNKYNIKIDASVEFETQNYKQLTKIKNNNFTSTCYDISYLKDVDKINTYNMVEFNDANFKTLKQPTLLNLINAKVSDLNNLKNNKGIIIVSQFRQSPFVILFIPSDSEIITDSTLSNLRTVLDYDIFNYNLLINK